MSTLERHWEVDPALQQKALEKAHGLVVDVGGRHDRGFPNSVTVGWEGDIEIDLSVDQLPYDDKQVDFLYCRHTLEDMTDPAHLLREIQRVAKAGYLECPSPVVEMTRGVDAYGIHRGYVHHRWFALGTANRFRLVAKYPIVELMQLPDQTGWLSQVGITGWNTHCLFEGDLEWDVLQNEQGFQLGAINEHEVPVEYAAVLYRMLDGFMSGIPIETPVG